MTLTRTLVCLISTAVVAGCSPDDTTPSPSPGNSQASSVVEEYCAITKPQEEACRGAEEAVTNYDQCLKSTVPCWSSIMRTETLIALRDCVKRQTCNGCECTPSQDECAGEAFAATSMTAAASDFIAACLARYDECGRDSNSFIDDGCQPGMLDDVYQKLRPCLDLACGNHTIQTCFDQVFNDASGGSCN